MIAVAVSGYILTNERLRFPFIQSSPYTLNAEFSTAQAVTPGQGQTVRVSGVQIGEVGSVSLKNGVGVVQLDIDPKYSHLIRTDATALLRPKTGLEDMFIELDPGSASAPRRQAGLHDPGLQHQPGRQPRRDPRPRSTPTRASTSTCSSTAPARG